MVMNDYEKIALEILKNRRAARARRSTRPRIETPEVSSPERSDRQPETAASDSSEDRPAPPTNDGEKTPPEDHQQRPQTPPQTEDTGSASVRRLKRTPGTIGLCTQRVKFIILVACCGLPVFVLTGVGLGALWTAGEWHSGATSSFSRTPIADSAATTATTTTTNTTTTTETTKTGLKPMIAPLPLPEVRELKQISLDSYECHDAGHFDLCNNSRDGSCILIFGSYPPLRQFGVVPLDMAPRFLNEKLERRFYRLCRKSALWYRPAAERTEESEAR